jgi:hypothetical protein
VTDLTTLAAVKAYAAIVTTADDAMLTSLITAYSQFVRSFCNRDFTPDNYEIWRDGRDSTSLMLPVYPVLGVTLLEIDGQVVLPQAAFGQRGYRFTDREIILDGLRFCWGHSNVHVFFSAGYLSIPADIAQAVNELVALRYKLRDKLEWSSKTLAGETVSLITKDMPSSVATVLKQYTRKVPL